MCEPVSLARELVLDMHAHLPTFFGALSNEVRFIVLRLTAHIGKQGGVFTDLRADRRFYFGDSLALPLFPR